MKTPDHPVKKSGSADEPGRAEQHETGSADGRCGGSKSEGPGERTDRSTRSPVHKTAGGSPRRDPRRTGTWMLRPALPRRTRRLMKTGRLKRPAESREDRMDRDNRKTQEIQEARGTNGRRRGASAGRRRTRLLKERRERAPAERAEKMRSKECAEKFGEDVQERRCGR